MAANDGEMFLWWEDGNWLPSFTFRVALLQVESRLSTSCNTTQKQTDNISKSALPICRAQIFSSIEGYHKKNCSFFGLTVPKSFVMRSLRCLWKFLVCARELSRFSSIFCLTVAEKFIRDKKNSCKNHDTPPSLPLCIKFFNTTIFQKHLKVSLWEIFRYCGTNSMVSSKFRVRQGKHWLWAVLSLLRAYLCLFLTAEMQNTGLGKKWKVDNLLWSWRKRDFKSAFYAKAPTINWGKNSRESFENSEKLESNILIQNTKRSLSFEKKGDFQKKNHLHLFSKKVWN